jgi:Tol biopolymer transport system component
LVGLDAAGLPAPASWPSISADGNVVVFRHSTSNVNAVTLTPDAQLDGGGSDLHLYARNLSAGTTTLVDANVPILTADREPFSGTSVSADGRYVAFDCWCQRVYDGPNAGMGHLGVYRADLATRDVIEADVNADGIVANGDSGVSSPHGLTADGSSILLGSSGDNLVAGDLNNHRDLFISTPQ